jgi:imidazolonepropionase-like amidohydrolase
MRICPRRARLLCAALACNPGFAAAEIADPSVLAAERHFADFLDAHGAVETIDSGLLQQVDGRDRSAWLQVRDSGRRLLSQRLPRLREQGLSAEELRAVRAMRTTFDELAGPGASMAPTRACRDASRTDAGLDDLHAALYACFDEIGNRVRFEGRQLTRSGALQLLQEVEDPVRRKDLFLALAPLWDAVNGDGSARSPYRRMIVQASAAYENASSPVEVAAAALGVGAADMERWLLEVLDAWRGTLGSRAPIEPWDFRYAYAEASRTLNAFVPRGQLARLNERFMHDLGVDTRALGILFDLDPRPGKAPIAYADAVRIGRATARGWRPAVARISGNYDRGGLYTLNELVHETGHALHIAAVRARPAFFWPDTLFMEAFADVPSWSVFDPAWQRKYLGRSVERPQSLREQYALVMLDVAWGLFEIRMLRDPHADPNAVWTEITTRYLGIAPHPELSWWAVRAQLVSNPGYMINYAAGAVLTADIRAVTRAAIGPFDAGNARWYAWLSERLLQDGAALDPPRLFARFLGRPVSPAALIAEIESIASSRPAVALAPIPHEPDSGSIAITCGTLVDGISDQPRKNATVLIRDGRIDAVNADAAPPADLPWLDLREHTCLPGLIDMHTHLTDRPEDTADLSVYSRRGEAEQVALSRDNALATLQAGFTSVRNVGTYRAWSDRELRDRIDRGELAGPRMQVTGFYLSIPKGGGDLHVPGMRRVAPQFRMGVARGARQFRDKARLALDGGADVLKVIASGAVLAYGGVPGAPEMTPDELRAVIQEAHARGRKVAAHAHGAQSVKEAILAGADTIEHASLIDDEGIALARERQVALSMDVYNGDYIDTEGRRQGWPAEFLRKNLETTEAQRQAFTRAHAAGAPIVYGTDAGVFPHGANARQFPIMVARGMSPMQAIRAATSTAARYMGWSERVGALTPGLRGDLIAVRGDPLADIARLQEVAVVVKGGLAFKLPPE